jgi:hypothetical protein
LEKMELEGGEDGLDGGAAAEEEMAGCRGSKNGRLQREEIGTAALYGRTY